MRRPAIAVAFALLFSACAARSAAPPTVAAAREPLDARAQLQRDLGEMFNAASVAHAAWAASFYSLPNAETIYTLNASRLMVPASNQKLLTTAAAAERLGWDYRFTTRVLTTGAIDQDGTLTGDVIVVGNGDPTINPRHPERWRAFDDWAATLKAKGVKIINGNLIGDDNAFEEPGWGVGWPWDDLQYGFGAAPSALQYNENQVEVMVGPGSTPGARAIISTSPLGSGLVIEHGVTTNAPAGETRVDIARIPGSPMLSVRGQIAADAKPTSINAAVDNPTRFYLTSLREAMARNGIFVSGSVIDVDDLQTAPRTDTATELILDRSPPLSEIIDVTMKWSRNIYAETLLLAMAPPGEPATGTRGLQSVRETLRSWGILPESYLPRDGSGLSRYDYATADALTRLLIHLSSDARHAALYRSTLPVSGVSGTLANRMKGTLAEGRVIAKTGTLSNVRALSGYVTTLAGETVAFSMIANNFIVPAAEIDAIMERALNRIVQLKR